MKSLTKSIRSKAAAHASHVQISVPAVGVLRDVQSAFFGQGPSRSRPPLGAADRPSGRGDRICARST